MTFDLEHLQCAPCEVMKLCTKFERNRAICDGVIAISVVLILWPWPLDLEVLQHFDCHAFKLCTEFEWSRITTAELTYWRFNTFLPCNFRGGAQLTAFSGVHGPNFTKLSEDIGRSSQHCTFVSEFYSDILLHFQTRTAQSVVEDDAKFRTFWPMWKLGEGGRDIWTNCWSFAYDRTSGIDVRPLHGSAVHW